jgi:hypothetical protein
VLVPNNTALTMSVRPIREPAKVEMRARLPKDADPVGVQEALCEKLTVAVDAPPQVLLEELAGDEVIMRIQAAPSDPASGGELAKEVLRAIDGVAARA